MEMRARIIGTSTPRFAKMVSWKYTHLPASQVSKDLGENHCRPTSRKLIQNVSELVGQIAWDKEFEWSYDLPPLNEVVTHIAVSRDGTTTPIIKEGYKETMCGTLSLYSAKGNRLHTIYVACAPEKGKQSFDEVMDLELGRIKAQFPSTKYIGLADGALNNWKYLEPRTDVQILDFFHACEHLAEVSMVMGAKETDRKKWLEEACHDLKHGTKGAAMLLREMNAQHKKLDSHNPEAEIPKELLNNITYFENNLKRMQYAKYQKLGYPIGSGVTEAACKVVAKQRLNNSGMKWRENNAQRTLLLRGLVCTEGRWDQFWHNIATKRA